MKNADMPAMPVCSGSETGVYNGVSYTKNFLDSAGLTKREMFAMHAMQGILANRMIMNEIFKSAEKNNSEPHDVVADIAIEHANALLTKLERTK